MMAAFDSVKMPLSCWHGIEIRQVDSPPGLGGILLLPYQRPDLARRVLWSGQMVNRLIGTKLHRPLGFLPNRYS